MGRCLVRRENQEPVESARRLERFVGRARCGYRRRSRGLLDRIGNLGLDCLTLNDLRSNGLRPTFGRVSRYGAMALSWSMDKIGPICRTVEDCAIVFDAIYGPDGKDATVVDLPFSWDASRELKSLKVGYLKRDFEKEREDKQWKANDEATLDVLRSLGFDLIPIDLPDYPIEDIDHLYV